VFSGLVDDLDRDVDVETSLARSRSSQPIVSTSVSSRPVDAVEIDVDVDTSAARSSQPIDSPSAGCTVGASTGQLFTL